VDRSITNLENAYWNVMPKPVADEYFRKLIYVNRHNVSFVRGVLPDESLPIELEKVRGSVAKLVNAEIARLPSRVVVQNRCRISSLVTPDLLPEIESSSAILITTRCRTQ